MTGPRYAELQVTTHFSFLRGASSCDELFARAGLETIATVPTLAGLGWHCVARRPLADGRARAPSA